ncbi:cytochrome P450, family 3, subfamily A [Mytilus galloprovincialis]|uniref:Cytochrome P450, family 3, subfamily A n=1 Tax=Mytilus galloprovincialis TaxID=29158 RepID=A0A8B6HSF8_MYTGA|nr:cytochrome P450, family 3, subfamily A [Mytilus galloprovincialis]
MDFFGIATIPGWLITILLFFMAMCLYSLYCQTTFWRLGIPGPRPTLFLGNIMEFVKKGVLQTDLDNLQKHGKIFGNYAGNLASLTICDVDIIKQICIKDFSKFPNRIAKGDNTDPYMKDAISLARDEHWKFLRSSISPTFSSGKMRQMMPLLQKCVNDMVEKLKKDTENGEVVDVCKYCGSFSMDVIASTAFGMDVDAQNDPDNAFIKNAKKAFSSGLKNPMLLFVLFFPFTRGILSYFKLSTLSKEMATFFHAAVNTAIDERKSESSKRQDLLGLMLNAHTDKEKSEENIELSSTTLKDFKKRPLTTNEILANSLTFFLAGYETTANALSFVLYCLALYPDYADKVRHEVADNIGKEKPTYDNVSKLQYLDMFVCEVLRLYGPAARFNRTTEEDVAIGGYKVPKGTDIQFAIGVIHRDPEFWPEPEVFDPERFTPENKEKRHPYAWLPFGVGPRNCVGMRLALIELKMAAVTMIQNFTVVRCDETEVPITFDKGGFIKAQNGIKLKLEKK